MPPYKRRTLGIETFVNKLTHDDTLNCLEYLWPCLTSKQKAEFYRDHRSEFEALAEDNPE